MCANEDGKEKTGASLPSPARSLSGLVTSPSRFSLAVVPNEARKDHPYYGTDITVLAIFQFQVHVLDRLGIV